MKTNFIFYLQKHSRTCVEIYLPKTEKEKKEN